MKRTEGKRISAVLLAIVLLFVLSCNAFAETIQDKIESGLEELLEKYNSSDSETQQSLQERFNAFLEENGLDDMDLSKLTETDIGKIISDFGDNLALEDFFALAQDAWASGSAMIQDVLNGGLGTSDGSNTATTKESVTSPNVIIAGTAPASSSVNVGIPAAASTTVQSEPTTYDVGQTTAANIVGAGVTVGETAPQAVIEDDSAMSTSAIVVLAVLSVATLAVIVAIVIFFVLKRK